jgi:hypothetical protein
MLKSAPASQLRLLAIPRLAAGGRWRVEAMRSLSEPCLLWFTKGQGRITISGVTRGYTAHNAVFIPAGVMHGFEAGPQVFGTAVFFGRDPKVVLPKSPLHLRIREVHAHPPDALLQRRLRPPRQRASAGQAHLRGAQASGRDEDPRGKDRRAARLQFARLLHTGLPASDRKIPHGLPPRGLGRFLAGW